MQVHDIKRPKGARKNKVIVGRGRGSGHGKRSGRGQTGQNARPGQGIIGSLEGGQMPLIRRLPKVGFRPHRPRVYQVVSVSSLERFDAGAVVDAPALKAKQLIKNIYKPYKILGNGDIKKKLTVRAYAFSKTATEKITKAGGQTETITAADVKKNASTENAK